MASVGLSCAQRHHMRIKLTVAELQKLKTLVDQSAGRGGFQNLVLQLWYHLDEASGDIDVSYLLLERINRYAFHYKSSYWRNRV